MRRIPSSVSSHRVQLLTRHDSRVPLLRPFLASLTHGRLERRLELIHREPAVVEVGIDGSSRRLVRAGGSRERQSGVVVIRQTAHLHPSLRSLLRGARSLLREPRGVLGGDSRSFRRGPGVSLVNGGDAVDGGNFGFTRDWLPVRVQLAVLHLRVSRGVRLVVRLVLGVRARVHRGGVLAELHHRRGRGRRGRRRGRVEVLGRPLVGRLVSLPVGPLVGLLVGALFGWLAG